MMGFPAEYIKGLQKVYASNRHFIKIGCRLFPGPNATLGVRQGCPLSMLLFCLALEPLLRHIAETLNMQEGDQCGSYADDIGVVLAQVTRNLRRIYHLFSKFARISNLQLNLNKCVVIPLCTQDQVERIRQLFIDIVPEWKGFSFSDQGEYLGVKIGPGAAANPWQSVIHKARNVTNTWKRISTGFFYNILGSNIFIFSLFQYLALFLKHDEHVGQFTDWHARRLFGGPGNWLPKEFLQALGDLGMPVELRLLKDSIEASKVRVGANLPHSISHEKGVELGRSIICFRENHESTHEHHKWHSNAFLINVLQSVRRASERFPHLDIDNPRSDGRKKIQKKVYEAIKDLNRPSRAAIFDKLRVRMKRWNFGKIPQGHIMFRAMTRIDFLHGKVSPKCSASYVKLLSNAWTTTRRMRSIRGRAQSAPCLFCKDGCDAVEHLNSCPVVLKLYKQFRVTCRDRLEFFALDQASFPTMFITKVKLINVLYSVYNNLHADSSHEQIRHLINAAVSINFQA